METRLRYLQFHLGTLILALAGPAAAQCTKDVDCKGNRICVRGTCVNPATPGFSQESRTLSRARAAQLIAAQQRLPRPQTVTIASKYLKRSWSKPVVGFGNVTVCVEQGDKYADVEQRLVYYQSQGLVTIGFETTQGECPAIRATVALTEAGKAYAIPAPLGAHKVRVWTLAMGDVTGIQIHEQFKTARADYRLNLVGITPFGANARATAVQETATFELFDDGWRIQPSSLETAAIRYQDPPITAALQEASRAVAAAAAIEEAAVGGAQHSPAQPRRQGAGREAARSRDRPDAATAAATQPAVTAPDPQAPPTANDPARMAAVQGRYARKGKPTDFLELNADGTSGLRQDGHSVRGNYTVHGDAISFTSPEMPGLTSKGRVTGDTIKDDEGIIWEKMTEAQRAAAPPLPNEPQPSQGAAASAVGKYVLKGGSAYIELKADGTVGCHFGAAKPCSGTYKLRNDGVSLKLTTGSNNLLIKGNTLVGKTQVWEKQVEAPRQ